MAPICGPCQATGSASIGRSAGCSPVPLTVTGALPIGDPTAKFTVKVTAGEASTGASTSGGISTGGVTTDHCAYRVVSAPTRRVKSQAVPSVAAVNQPVNVWSAQAGSAGLGTVPSALTLTEAGAVPPPVASKEKSAIAYVV